MTNEKVLNVTNAVSTALNTHKPTLSDKESFIEALKRLPRRKEKTRKTLIKNAKAFECTSKNNINYTAVQIEYQYKDLKVPEWRKKKVHADYAEGQLILDAYPFDEECLYEVETKLDKEGFWRWTSITKLEKGSL